MTIEEGWFAGEEDHPAKYQLERHIFTGGEGSVWRAVSQVDGVDVRWALKILRDEHVTRKSGESPMAAMRRWKDLWAAIIDRTMVVRDVPGLVPAHSAFIGAAPHQHRHPPQRGEQTLYLVTPWVDGPDLETWLDEHRPERAAVVDVVTQLCEVVDQLAELRWVHRDLCPRNVMLQEASQVQIIDFAFMMRAGMAATDYVTKRGYTAPEADVDQLDSQPPSVDPAIDRYSVGAVVYRMLTGEKPPQFAAYRAVQRGLVADGFGPGLADHVAALLHPDPRKRPARLAPWAEQFRLLARLGTTAGYADVAIAVDGNRETTVFTAGAEHVAAARLAPSAYLQLQPETGSPMCADSVAAGRLGDGRLAVFARDKLHRLYLRTGDRWRIVAGQQARGVVRAAELGDGTVSGFLLDQEARLAEVSIAIGGDARCVTHGRRLRQLYAATAGPGGQAVLAAEAMDGQLLCGPPDGLRQIGLSGIGTAALCTNEFDEVVCVAARAGDRQLEVLGSPGGDWIDREQYDAPCAVRAVACVWLRTGLAIAVAGDTGVWVSGADPATWTPLWRGPAAAVVLSPGVGWRLHLAALAEGRTLFVEETTAGFWPPSAAQL